MPKTVVVFYKDDDGSVPVLDWLKGDVAKRDRRISAKCRAWINRLRSEGTELRRPTADYLRDGIYELRVKYGHTNYRILYFFQETTAAILAHGLVKEDKVPDKDIDLALQRKVKFESDPQRYSYDEEKENQ